jgi:hypothetical protein
VGGRSSAPSKPSETRQLRVTTPTLDAQHHFPCATASRSPTCCRHIA